MTTGDRRLEQIAVDVLDGQAVDWAEAETHADAGERCLIGCLKVVAAVADVNRPPDRWGHLCLVERIGSGASGDVYRAWDSRLDRDVALKLVPAHARAADDGHASIIHEGRLLARVYHPNVVTIHGAEQIGDRIGLWMELVRGRTLEQMLLERTVFTAAEVARIGVALCDALEAVHRSGLIHRDVKAHNVMLADDGRVVLMDFGAGRELADRASTDLTGTPLYAAPEVLAGRPATVQSDVYSVGVLLFHLLTGSYPVQGRSVHEIRAAHAARRRSEVRAVRPGAGRALAAAIDRALDGDVGRRHRSAGAFASALRRARDRGSRLWLTAGVVGAAVVMTVGTLSPRVRPAADASAPTIAVLPFENRSTTAGGDELADGLTSEIQGNLASIGGLALRSAGSSVAFRTPPRDLVAAASALGVEYALEGSVDRTAGGVRIDARLTHISGDDVMWSESFNREARALPSIVNDIALAVVGKLGVTRGRVQRHTEIAPELYYQFLRARAFHGRRGPENSARAAALFQGVVDQAPDYAPAWAGLASALAQLSRPSSGEEIIQPDPRIGPAALTAYQLDPLLAEAHAALGALYAQDRDWVNARMSYLKALELNPSLTEARSDFVLGVLLPVGDTDEALRQLELARRVEPLSLDVRRTLALVLVEAGRYDQAIEHCRWILQHDARFPYVDVWLGRALYLSGRFQEARQILDLVAPQYFGYLGYLLAVSGERDKAEALIAANPEKPSRVMLIYAGLGDRDRAYDMLARTAEVNWWRAATWLRRPEMALLRRDPRMPALLQTLRVPE